MELRERAERLLRPHEPTPIPPVTESTRLLSRSEQAMMNRRWLRGAMCFLAIICYGLSLFEETVITHSLILVFSLAGEAAIIGIYRAKARVYGITNRAGDKPTVNVFHSPLLDKMLLEMLIWIIQTPPIPGLARDSWFMWLDTSLLLRFYVVVMYATNATQGSSFARGVASVVKARLTHRFYLRGSLLSWGLLLPVTALVGGLLLLGTFIARVEGLPWVDAVHLTVGSASLVGLGDVTPVTAAGRTAAVAAWLLGLLALVGVIGAAATTTRLGPAGRHLHALFRSNAIRARLPPHAAKVLQRAWRLHAARRARKGVITRQIAAYLLSQQVITFRDMRRELRHFEAIFLHSIRTVEDYMNPTPRSSPGVTPQTSRPISPVSTPRARQGLSSFQEFHGKADRHMSLTTTPKTPRMQHQQKQQATVADATPTATATGTRRSLTDLEQMLSRLEGSLDTLKIHTERLQSRLGSRNTISV
ncbi:ion transport protein [Trypanosoma theileri]|uniref:Ion transport protein n=1 Tax=Trypanosoma theileri TaxID=67003 RepID=A0A1X0NP80_9TRYP|nr:ion transport protein [Trypanosoma theileri]ORC86318.1 ion transport protein [Trypanosoma theileri]